MKRKLHIRAKYKTTGKVVDLYFYSIKQAKYFNPSLIDFRIMGYE